MRAGSEPCLKASGTESGVRLAAETRVTMRFLRKLLVTDAPASVALIRAMVGGVFLSEGVQKFLYPELRGAGRFATLGIPFPEFSGPFVGAIEIVCGSLILLGLFTRWAAVPLLVIMAVAIYTTQIPTLQKEGFWFMANRIRTDFSMALGALFLLVAGGGRWSLDARLIGYTRNPTSAPSSSSPR